MPETEVDVFARKINAIQQLADRITASWNADTAVYPGHVDTLHRLVGELYALTGRTPPEG